MSASTSSSPASPPLTPPVTESISASELPSPAETPVGDLLGRMVEFEEAHYLLEKLLGAGGMGEVYLARRVVDAGDVQWNTADLAAIKVVRRDLAPVLDVKTFADEARLHWHLRHPNVVEVRGVTEADGTLYVLMEYLEGHDLRMLLMAAESLGKRLAESAVCNILAQVADALDYVHRATDDVGTSLHVVHRDVSPSNICVTASGVVKLVDFGLAKHDAEWREQTRSSWSGFKGKPMYLSPEQVNHQPLDGRSDLFALGSILVECLTGRRLFDGGQEVLILHAIRNVTPGDVERALQGVPEGLKAICHKLLARDREARYQTGKEVAAALRSWAFGEKRYLLGSADLVDAVAELVGLHGEGEEDAPSPLEQPPSSQSGRSSARSRPLRIAVAALILAAVALLVAISVRRHRPPPTPPVEQNLMLVSPPSSPPPELPALEEARPLALAKKPLVSVARCAGLSLAAAVAAGCPPVRVPTHTRTGDCTVQAPPRDIEGHKVPEVLPVYFVSLNGEKCAGLPPRPGYTCEDDPKCCPPTQNPCFSEPCPAGPGELVLMSNDDPQAEVPIPEEFFQGALFRGKARVEPEPAVIKEMGSGKGGERRFTGRTLALFTEMRLKNGNTVPICGVLYQGAFETTPSGSRFPGEKPPGMNKEGLPVLASEYFGDSATPTATPYIRLFWP
ncbi:MAG TPA: serine/threonine-protein kinase [Myxococcales bacterium]|nr:serine/threonine-protein kinase [Myxococcales bacterium]